MYCTIEQVRGLLKDDIMGALLGDRYVADPDEREDAARPILEQAIVDAGAEIDGYLARRYPVPLSAPPPVINKYAKDIAVYNLVSRIGVGGESDRENNYLSRYRFALKFLTAVAAGTASLGLEAPAKQAASGFQVTGPRRCFGRDQMRGM